MTEEQAKYIPEKPEPRVTMLEQITDAIRKQEARYRIERVRSGAILCDSDFDVTVFRGSEHECRRERCRLMAEAVMNIIGKQEDQ